ncbi:proton-conducting transporter transmembrane domain-containing protein [Yaniella halotolerans]|uniref:proton-conducting transporter transmembrane domain-containing protein n=1 Tax=Yaniella halotolerans TaxID=225453 RepID=UPI000595239C|nr:proton-conducting transporter membrane subunit [Yaniella halotolerans]
MLIALSLLLPALIAALIPLAGVARPAVRDTARRVLAIGAPAAILPSIAAAIAGPGTELDVPWLLFGVTFAVDTISRGLLLIGALLYGAALMSISWAKLRNTEKAFGTLSAFLLASYTGNIGVYLAADTISFYLSFAVMSFSAVGLIVHYRAPESYRATAIYLIMTVISETALLAGLLLTAHIGGNILSDAPEAVLASERTGLILTLLLIAFGVKAGTAPLHVWLPLAHPAAPPAASAVLSGAMVKAGMVGFLRFFPLQTDNSAAGDTAATLEIFGWVLMILSLLGAFAAALIGVAQTDGKVVLAYSTISQMGFIGALIAAGLLDRTLAEDTVDAAVLYAVHHGLAKGALFLGVPVIKHYGRGLSGIVVTIGMVGAGFAVAGAPITSGGIGKYVSKDAVEGLKIAGVGLEYILPLVATGSIVLLLRFLWVVLTEQRDPQRSLDGELLAWLGVCIAGIVVPWMIGAQWSPLSLPEWADPQTLWDSTWPIGLGLALGGIFWWLSKRGWLPRRERDQPAIPAGDLVAAEESWARILQDRGGAALDSVHNYTGKARGGAATLMANITESTNASIEKTEDNVRQWPRFGTGIMLLLTLILVLSLWIGGTG